MASTSPHLFLAFAAVILCAGPSSAQSSESASSRPATPALEVNALSFNILWGADGGRNGWERRKTLVFDVFRRQRPDVAGMQEVKAHFAKDIVTALPRFASYQSPGTRNAILYDQRRFRLDASTSSADNDAIAKEQPPRRIARFERRPLVVRLIERRSGRGIYVYTIHAHHRSRESRQWSALVLARRIQNRKYKEPVVVTGDFNAAETSASLRFLLGRQTLPGPARNVGNATPLIDTFRTLHKDAETVRTLHFFRGPVRGRKIDHVLVLPGSKVLAADIVQYNVDGRYPSDHFPVSARVILAAAKKRRRVL